MNQIQVYISHVIDKIHQLRLPTFGELQFFIVKFLLTRKQLIGYISLVLNIMKTQQSEVNATKDIYTQTVIFYPFDYEIVFLGREYRLVINPINFLKSLFSKYIMDNLMESEQPSLQNEIARFCPSDIKLMLLSTQAKSDQKDDETPLYIALEMLRGRGANTKMLLGSMLSPIAIFVILIPMMEWFNDSQTKALIAIAEQQRKSPHQFVIMADKIEVFTTSHTVEIALVFILIYLFYSFSLPNMFGKFRTVLESTPVLGFPFTIYKLIQAESFLRMMTVLYTNSMDTHKALALLHSKSNLYMKWRIKEMQEEYKRYAQESDVYSTQLFERDLAFQLSIYMKSKDATKQIKFIASNITELVDGKIKLAAMILPIVFSAIIFAYAALVSIVMVTGTNI